MHGISFIVLRCRVVPCWNALNQSSFAQAQKRSARTAFLLCRDARRIEFLHCTLPALFWACSGGVSGCDQCCFAVSVCHVFRFYKDRMTKIRLAITPTLLQKRGR